jgi:hypothetical protein
MNGGGFVRKMWQWTPNFCQETVGSVPSRGGLLWFVGKQFHGAFGGTLVGGETRWKDMEID